MTWQLRAGQADEMWTGADGDVERLEDFLDATEVSIVDVMRGAATGTRRLLLGEPRSRSALYTVAVADRPDAATAIAAEARLLAELGQRALPPLGTTLPRIIARVAVGERPAVVMTAVLGPRTDASFGRIGSPSADYLHAVGSWLEALWRSTAGVPQPVALGRDAADRLLARYFGSRQLAEVLGAVNGALSRVEEVRVRRTAVHGCLCVRHAQVRDGSVVGVDDWGLGTPNGEPLRDLGGFAVRSAGRWLPEVIAGRSGPARAIRDFVRTGLTASGVPVEHWRDVLVLAQAERAVAALEAGRTDEIGLLAEAVTALPPESGEPVGALCE